MSYPTSFDLTNGFCASNPWTLAGSKAGLPLVDPGCDLLLTDTSNSVASAAWAEMDIVNSDYSFASKFGYSIYGGNNDGAEGITFTIHQNGDQLNTLGGSGASLGIYSSSLTRALVIELDTFKNNEDLANDDAIQVKTYSSTSDVTDLGYVDATVRMTDGECWVDYNGEVLEIYLNNNSTKPSTPNLSVSVSVSDLFDSNQNVYVGFTASTGGKNDFQSIRSFELTQPSLTVATTASLEISGFAYSEIPTDLTSDVTVENDWKTVVKTAVAECIPPGQLVKLVKTDLTRIAETFGTGRRDLSESDSTIWDILTEFKGDCQGQVECEQVTESLVNDQRSQLQNRDCFKEKINKKGQERGITQLENSNVTGVVLSETTNSTGGDGPPTPAPDGGGVFSDPIILGLQGQVFKFEGKDMMWYSNLASESMQWNTKFKTFDSCPVGENMFVSDMTLSLTDVRDSKKKSDIMIMTTNAATEECRSDPNKFCLGEGTLHISFDGGKTFTSEPGEYHFGSESRLVAHNTYAACSRKWYDYEVSKASSMRRLRENGRRTSIQEKKPLQLVMDVKSEMIDSKECGSWIGERVKNNDLFQQRGHWSTLYIETPLVSFHVEYRRSDWVEPKCEFQSLDAWMTKVSENLEHEEWNGILGETKYKIYDLTTAKQIKSDRHQLLRGKDDADYEVEGPFGTEFAAQNKDHGVTSIVSSVIESIEKSIF